MGNIHKEVMKRLSKLPYYEAKVLEFRYAIDSDHQMTVEEVAVMVGKTVEEVKELERSGLKTLRQKPS